MQSPSGPADSWGYSDLSSSGWNLASASTSAYTRASPPAPPTLRDRAPPSERPPGYRFSPAPSDYNSAAYPSSSSYGPVSDDAFASNTPPSRPTPRYASASRSDPPPLASQLAGYASIARANLPAILGPAKRYAEDFAISYPLTSFQISAGVGLHLVSSVGLFPGPTMALFHPRYALVPRMQLYRIPPAFLVMGGSVFDVGRRAWTFFEYGSKLEARLGSSADGFLDWRDMTPEKRITELWEWARSNTYLHVQVVSAVTILATEVVVGLVWPGDTGTGGHQDPTAFYPLTPHLELSTLFLWAFLEPSTTRVSLFGLLPVQPLYLPIAMSLTSGVQAWGHAVKGLLAAVVAAKVVGLKRPDSGEDMVEWLGGEVDGWRKWAIEGERRQVRRGGRIVRDEPGAVGRTGQARPTRGGFLGTEAAAVTQESTDYTQSGGISAAGVQDWLAGMLPPPSRQRRASAREGEGHGTGSQGRRLGD